MNFFTFLPHRQISLILVQLRETYFIPYPKIMEPKEMISLAISLLMGVLTAYFAKNRNKSPLLWFFIGMFFGLFGFIALFFFPVEKKTNPQVEKPLELTVQPQKEHVYKGAVWFYADKDHKQQGPIQFDEMQRLWNLQEVTQDTYVWTQGMKEWKMICEELELRHQLQKN
jgi:uncharacterized protein DUF4339